MERKLKIKYRRAGLFLTVVCLLCVQGNYLVKGEQGEEYFTEMEGTAGFGGGESSDSTDKHASHSHGNLTESDSGTGSVRPESPQGEDNASKCRTVDNVTNDSTNNSANPLADGSPDNVSAAVADDSQATTEEGQKSISENTTEFVNPIQKNSCRNVHIEAEERKESPEVSQNTPEMGDNRGKTAANKLTIPNNPTRTSMPARGNEEVKGWILIGGLVLSVWGVIRLMKRLCFVYGKL